MLVQGEGLDAASHTAVHLISVAFFFFFFKVHANKVLAPCLLDPAADHL